MSSELTEAEIQQKTNLAKLHLHLNSLEHMVGPLCYLFTLTHNPDGTPVSGGKSSVSSKLYTEAYGAFTSRLQKTFEVAKTAFKISRSNARTGFNGPVFFRREVVDFFRNPSTMLGGALNPQIKHLLDPKTEDIVFETSQTITAQSIVGPLRNQLFFTGNALSGLASPTTVINLFVLHIKLSNNSFKVTRSNRTVYGNTQQMIQAFGNNVFVEVARNEKNIEYQQLQSSIDRKDTLKKIRYFPTGPLIRDASDPNGPNFQNGYSYPGLQTLLAYCKLGQSFQQGNFSVYYPTRFGTPEMERFFQEKFQESYSDGAGDQKAIREHELEFLNRVALSLRANMLPQVVFGRSDEELGGNINALYALLDSDSSNVERVLALVNNSSSLPFDVMTVIRQRNSQ